MSSSEHVYYFSSEFSKHNSTTGFFYNNLPVTLNLPGKWKCGLIDIFAKTDGYISDQQTVFIVVSFCETSLVHDQNQLPVLRKVKLTHGNNHITFTKPLYINVKQKQISNFNINFLNKNLDVIHFGSDSIIELTLHFYKHG